MGKRAWTAEDETAAGLCENRVAVIRANKLSGVMVDCLARGWCGKRISDDRAFGHLEKRGLVRRSEARGFEWTGEGAAVCAVLFPGGTHYDTAEDT